MSAPDTCLAQRNEAARLIEACVAIAERTIAAADPIEAMKRGLPRTSSATEQRYAAALLLHLRGQLAGLPKADRCEYADAHPHTEATYVIYCRQRVAAALTLARTTAEALRITEDTDAS